MSESQQEQRTVLFRSGEARVSSSSTEDIERRLSEIIGQFLQVHNLALLLGAGTTFHLGSPRIRSVSKDGLLHLIESAGYTTPEVVDNLLQALTGDTAADLEQLLATLSAAIVYSSTTSNSELTFGGDSFPVEDVIETRRLVNRSLAHACDLPSQDHVSEDPWGPHNEFFRRMLRSRRPDLPRSRVFTTNYDLVIERSLDAAGITCIDGFIGSVERTFRPESYSRDLYLVPRPGERRVLRVPELIYLYKLHGSINWQADPESPAGVVRQIDPSQRDDDALALIYPTPQKENDALGYPYSDLLRLFASAIAEPETALLIAGYSFADDHINRLIFRALSSNATLQVLVIEPFAVLDSQGEGAKTSSVAGRLASTHDSRIAVLTGKLATFDHLATEVMPDPDEMAKGDAEEINEAALAKAFTAEFEHEALS